MLCLKFNGGGDLGDAKIARSEGIVTGLDRAKRPALSRQQWLLGDVFSCIDCLGLPSEPEVWPLTSFAAVFHHLIFVGPLSIAEEGWQTCKTWPRKEISGGHR